MGLSITDIMSMTFFLSSILCVVLLEAYFYQCMQGPGAVWVGFMRQNVWDAHSGAKSEAAVKTKHVNGQEPEQKGSQ